jgi:AmmeMemoRadiSam system protein A
MESLAKHEKIQLLRLARESIERRMTQNLVELIKTGNKKFEAKAGAFVTLHHQGELRGCIGRIRALDPLEIVIQEMAVAAAFKDPRFPPLQEGEMFSLEIEISVLSPTWVISNIQEIEVGRHGLLVSDLGLSGLLLPQVPVEQGWNRETFLSHTCLKAGLPGEHWKKAQPRIEAFTAMIFSEKELEA